MANKNNYFFAQLAQPAAKVALDAVYEHVWKQVAAKAVGQLAKGEVKRQAVSTINSFIEFTFDKENAVPKIVEEVQPHKIKLDEWAVFNVGIDERHSLDSDKRTSTIITNNSNKNKKVVARKGSDQVSLGGLSKQKEDVFVRVAEDPESPQEEDKMRNKYLLDERVHFQSEADRIKREEFERNQNEMKGKLSKDKKKITFDYNGKVMNLGNESAPKKALMSTIGYNNSLLRMNVKKEQEILKKVDKKKVESEKIERTTFKGQPKRSNKSELGSKVELELDGQKNIIEDDGMIENGVKVIELKGDRQMVKQNKPKNSNSFLKYRLQEFKDYIRQRKFKEHSLKLADEFDRPRLGPRTTEANIKNTEANKTVHVDQQQSKKKKLQPERQASSLTSQKNNTSLNNVILPEIALKPNQRSSKYFEQIAKDKHKHRVKSVKIDNEHVLSSFYYKNMRNSNRHRGHQLRSDSSNISINEQVYNQVFEYPA